MSSALAKAIVAQDKDVLAVFSKDFKKAAQWLSYLKAAFGEPASVDSMLAKDALAVGDFQALYIACWIHYPVEKGTYMLKLRDEQRPHVKAGYTTLSLRISSHYSGHGRSAASGWSFLEGYEELLVQLEGGGKNSQGDEKYLFLKSEGHQMVSFGHAAAWLNKIKTGQGLTASDALHELAKSGDELGIHERAAENFDNSYKAFLKFLGLYETQKKMTTVQAAIVPWYRMTQQYIKNVVPKCKDSFTSRLRALELDPDLTAAQAGKLPNVKLAKLITDVLLPIARDMYAANWERDGSPTDEVKTFGEQVGNAAQALSGIAEHLEQDAAMVGEPYVSRHFEEVRVAPSTLEVSLSEFVRVLKND